MLKTPKGLQLYYQETPAQVLSCKICEIFKNNYFEEHLRTAASNFPLTTFPRGWSSQCQRQQ